VHAVRDPRLQLGQLRRREQLRVELGQLAPDILRERLE
jgi:hypothetical protein